jgi:hypothetical protein
MWLETHPRHVITLIFESYVSAADTARAFEDSGLVDYVYTHDAQAGWPTLGQMIADGERVVVLTDDPASGGYAWYQYVWSLAWETHFSYSSVAAFSCAGNRGSPANDLFFLNHFVTPPVLSQALLANSNPLLIDRAVECWQHSGRFPNYPTADFATTVDLERCGFDSCR